MFFSRGDVADHRLGCLGRVTLDSDDAWTIAWAAARSTAMRATLVMLVRDLERPTIGDLLDLLGDQRCDIQGSDAGDVTIAELLGGAAVGPTVNDLIEQLDLDPEDPMHDARSLELDLIEPLADVLGSWASQDAA